MIQKYMLKILWVLICLSPLSLLADTSNSSIVTLSYPKDNSLTHETTINLVLKAKVGYLDEIEVITPVTEIKIKVDDAKSIYCKSIFLKLGENTISVRSYKNNIMIDEDVIKIYVTSQIYKEYKYPSKVYQQNFFHTDKKEAECSKCHDMSLNETDGVAFIDVKESNCYQCHNKLTDYKYAHAPAVNWLCTSCHNGKVGSDNENSKGLSKYIAAEPVNKECFRCHKTNLKLWNSYKYRHEPLDSGRCNKCHNPHSSPYKMFVRKPVDQICLGCHSNKHTVEALDKYPQYTLTDTKKDCISCHSPHAASKAFFLIDENKK